MFRTIVFVVAGLLVVAGLFAASGFLMPREHQARASRSIKAPLTRVWALISDLQRSPQWLTSAASVEAMPQENGHDIAKVTDSSGGTLTYVLRESRAPDFLVREVRDPGEMFGGTWTFELAPQDGGTLVTITENGWIGFAPFRPVQRFFIGFDSTMNAYLDDLMRAAEKPEAS